jgi:hypothetical protein
MVISPACLRSVFPQQPGLKVAISPAEVSVAGFSPACQRLLFSPQNALVVSSPAKSPSGSGSVEVILGKGGPFPSSGAIPQQGGDWSVVEFLSRVPRAP